MNICMCLARERERECVKSQAFREQTKGLSELGFWSAARVSAIYWGSMI